VTDRLPLKTCRFCGWLMERRHGGPSGWCCYWCGAMTDDAEWWWRR